MLNLRQSRKGARLQKCVTQSTFSTGRPSWKADDKKYDDVVDEYDNEEI
jgi:hypothetical protein